MSNHGRYERQKPKKSKKKIALVICAVILALLIIGIVAGVLYYNQLVGKMNQVKVPDLVYTMPPEMLTESTENPGAETTAEAETETTVPTETTEPAHVPSSEDYINFLVVGQAAREGEAERFADSMILVTLNTYEKTLTTTSMLRDSFVRPPDWKGKQFGRIKLTSVYHLGSYYSNGDPAGSMELMNLTLYKNFGVEVDHNFEVDFDVFIEAIDLLGGITVYLTEAEAQYLNDDDRWVCYDVTPGYFHLDGAGALCYARMRKAEGDSDSDIKRTARQRAVIESVLNELRQKSLSELNSIAQQLASKVTTSMSTSEITEMLLTLLPMLPELTLVKGGTCPADSWGEMVDIFSNGEYHSVLQFDQNQTWKHMRAITEGETS